MSYLLLADSHTFVCRSWDDLAARLVWAREEGYRTAKARRANGYVDRPLWPSEQARLVAEATRLALGYPGETAKHGAQDSRRRGVSVRIRAENLRIIGGVAAS